MIQEIDGREYYVLNCYASPNGNCSRLWVPPPGTLIIYHEAKPGEQTRAEWCEAIPEQWLPHDERCLVEVVKSCSREKHSPEDAYNIRQIDYGYIFNAKRYRVFPGEGGPLLFSVTNKGDRTWHPLSIGIDGNLTLNQALDCPRQQRMTGGGLWHRDSSA